MSFRNPPENGHEERAGQASGRLRGVLESRLASRRKFFAGPSAVPAPSSNKDPENPEGPDGQVGRATAAEGLPTSAQIQSPVAKAIAVSEDAILPEGSSSGTEPPANLSPSEATGMQIRGEELSVWLAATGEAIKNPEEQPPAADPNTELAESHRHHGVERRGSYRYKVERVEVLFGWRQAENGVSTGSAGMAGERTVKPSSVAGLADRGSASAEPKPGRDPETASPPADFDHHEVRVHDISLTGVCLIVDRLPPIDRDLWVGVKGTWPIVWSRVILRSLSEPHPGRFMLRHSLNESCPYDLFKLAVMQMGAARKAT